MYEELIERLQGFAAGTMQDEDAELAFNAINAIEELQKPKWIKFTTRELDEEEKKDNPDWDWILECEMPDEGQEILVSNGRHVWLDCFCNDGYGCYLDGGDDVIGLWWMPLPEPPKEEGE